MKVKVLILKFLLILIFFSASFYIFFYKESPLKFIKPKKTADVGNFIEKNYYDTKLHSYPPDLDFKFIGNGNPDDADYISGKEAIVVDINSGEVLFEKNSVERMKIASITKIMTAVIALEHAELSSKFVVSSNAATVGENSMGIVGGETYTLEELLYGLILESGNDSAYAIAEGVAGNVSVFVTWMNMKAKELGLRDTEFFDPSGLDDRNYSTAQDLVQLSRYAMKNPDFKRVSGTLEKEISGEGHRLLKLSNQTNLLRTYPGVSGIKTGYTEEAGYCLVTYAKNSGKELIGVVLNSKDRRYDMIKMLDKSYKNIGIIIEHNLH